jgi:hypothetical protein
MNNSHTSSDASGIARGLTSRGRFGWGVSLAIGLIVAGLIVARSWHRTARAETDGAAAIPAVAVIKVDREDLSC